MNAPVRSPMDVLAPDTPLLRLRRHLAASGIAACLVPSSDPHLSEYLPARWQGRRWLSGFDGSAGSLVVGAQAAELWVDSRYWEQAGRQLQGSGIALRKAMPGVLREDLASLCSLAGPGGTVAVDADVLSLAGLEQLEALCRSRGNPLRTDIDPLAGAWPGRPGLPAGPIAALPPGAQGHERADRMRWLRERMQAHGADWHFVSALDEIAWLLGLRGSDVPYNPVFLAHLLVGPQGATLFIDPTRMPVDVRQALASEGIALAPYAGAREALRSLAPGASVLIDPRRTTAGHVQALPQDASLRQGTNPCALMKACKSDAEAAAIRRTMVQDGVALAEFFAELQEQLQGGAAPTELDIDAGITAARMRRPGFVGPSFATIAAFNANGAMPHYVATARAHARIAGNGLLLIDSGGQYTGGTTDITRMVAVGTPGDAQRRDCTLVLQALIALSTLHFPHGTRAPMIDAVARAPLWREHIDYGHGTGHGVGWYLNVHEGPQSISVRAEANADSALLPGMVTSVEPGIYRPGQWGVRIENLLLAIEKGENAFGRFMAFETLTLCPIDLDCLCLDRLTDAEVRWIDQYHATVREALLPEFASPQDERARRARQWLVERTRPVLR
ncbi:aminopeptidase P family protein [Paracidovorax avenae]|uniref:aminopeptidase P family protein n=1 Tax=Paracidovorax avenae TaxID=80867 RepID=UPI0006B378DC|nr:aminopeptidase P family protein [Paracidovorax avenae]